MFSGGRDRKPGVGYVFVTLVLVVMGFGIVIPVLPQLVTEFNGGSVAGGSHAYGWLLGVFGLVQFVSAPILGSLSDRFGRRKVILIAQAGAAIDYVIMGLAPTFGWLFVARMISGATSGSLASCNAYIADVTPPEKRAQGYGIIGAAFGIGFVVGPALGGFLGGFGLRVPFFVAAGIVAINALYGIFLLPESLPADRRRAFSWKRANPVGSLMNLANFRGVLDMAGAYFIFQFANLMMQGVWVLYMGWRYGWSTTQVGLSFTLSGLMLAVVQGRFVRVILKRLGERRGLVTGLCISAFAMICYGTVPEGWMIYLILPISAFGGIAGPAAQALLTRHVPPDQQGSLQGSLAALTSLASIFAPLISSWSFGTFIAPGRSFMIPGISFYEASGLFIAASGLALLAFRVEDAKSIRPILADPRPIGFKQLP